MSCRIITAFSAEKNADSIASVLENHGVTVNCRCHNGQEVIAAVEETGSGVVVCGAEFSDMSADDLSLWINVPTAFLVLDGGGNQELQGRECLFTGAAHERR